RPARAVRSSARGGRGGQAARATVLRYTLAIAALVLAGCAPSQVPSTAPAAPAEAPKPSAPKRVVGAILGDPFALNYQISSAGAFTPPGSEALEELVSVGLTTVDNQGALVRRLADTVPTTDNGLWKIFPDGSMETTWKIRSNAQWHDGTPFTSADMLFTAEVVQDLEVGVFRNRAYDAIDSVTAPDPSTVTIKWKRPYIAAD